jgi:O-antigen/teichoic acid export membrane protein
MERPHLKRAVLRGGVAKMFSQATNVLVRLGTLMVFARLLSPTDFGLIGMVVAVTGVMSLLKDFGLSAATVQRTSVSNAQMSSLFWLNTGLGVLVWLLCSAAAPVMVRFYHEDRLFWITIVVASGLFFNAASVQHNALLQRQMRFGALSLIEVLALLSSTAIGLVMAKLGLGYWALVGWSVALPLVSCLGVWIASGWIPQRPQRGAGVRSMVRFGSLVTLNILVVQVAYNLDKVLLGRYWGAEVLGFYGRANQLTTMATDNLLGAIGSVAFPALSRAQGDSAHFENYFLKGYKLTLTMAFPLAATCMLFAKDIVAVLLGPDWAPVAAVLRFSSPLIVIYAMINPSGWLMYSLGKVGLSLKISLVIFPVVTLGYLVGLKFGAIGVAAGYTIAMALWVFPHLVWCTQGTTLTAWKMLRVAKTPAIASVLAAVIAYGVHAALAGIAPLPRLLVEGLVLSLAYVGIVLRAREERTFYANLFRSLRAAGGEIDAPRPGAA